MGQYRAEIMKGLGEAFQFHDPPKQIRKHYPYSEYRSVLICTPPETHENAILEVWNQTGGQTPIFVEKPLIAHSDSLEGHPILGLKKSMVGCNYRFNEPYLANLRDICNIGFGYPSFVSSDLIHFFDLFYEHFGEYTKAEYKDQTLMLEYPNKKVFIYGTVDILPYHSVIVTNGDGVKSDFNNCPNSFVKEMEHWFNVVDGKEESVNKFGKAYTRCLKLFSLLECKV